MDSLPPRVLEKILLYLPPSDRLESALTCRRWSQAVSAPSLLGDIQLVIRCNSLDASILRRSTRHYRNVKIMSEGDFLENDWDFWKKFGPSLRDLQFCLLDMSAAVFYRILSLCPRLESLKVYGSPSRTLKLPKTVLKPGEKRKSFPLIRHLSLQTAMTEKLLAQFLELMPNITSLSLLPGRGGGPRFEDIIAEMSVPVPMFVKLHLAQTDIDDATIKRLAELYSGCLQELRVESCSDLTDEAFEAIGSCTELRLLSLSYAFNIKDSHIQKISRNAQKLEYLEMYACNAITSEGFKHIPEFKCLRYFGSPSCKHLDVDASSEFGKILTLRHLVLNDFKCDIQILRHLMPLKNLRSLILRCVNFTPECLALILEKFGALERLELCCCTTLFCAYMCPSSLLEELRSSEFLEATGSEETSVELPSEETGSSKLKYLRLKGESITDAFLARISARHPYVESLILSSCDRITDAGLESLLRSEPRLRKLDLYECRRLTDRSLQVLENLCPLLRSLGPRSAKLSQKAVNQFKERRPSVKIHDLPIRW